MSEDPRISVVIVDKALEHVGIIANAAFVLGLTAGREMPSSTFGPDVVDGEGQKHLYLTNIAHFIRKAGQSKIKSLRGAFSDFADVLVIDYSEDAAPSDYAQYQTTLGSHSGDEIRYRAIHVYGPQSIVLPLTKNLSKLE